MRAVVIGFGAVGRRAAEALATDPTFDEVVVVHRDPGRARVQAIGLPVRVAAEVPDADVVVVATPAGQRKAAQAALTAGSHVVCATDDPGELRAVLHLDSLAKSVGKSVVAGAVMAPGLSCVLASLTGSQLSEVQEVHVASVGTGGPACARRHHSALTGVAVDWEDGDWRRRPGGSGRELVWFPEPVGGADCYRASLADAMLLVPHFPDARRVTSRLEATRRDRLTSWLPMLRKPHPEGLVGAVRVEVRGRIEGRAETRIMGAAVPPGIAGGLVSSLAARWAATGQMVGPGAGGLAVMVPKPGAFLAELTHIGLPVWAFEGRYTPGDT